MSVIVVLSHEWLTKVWKLADVTNNSQQVCLSKVIVSQPQNKHRVALTGAKATPPTPSVSQARGGPEDHRVVAPAWHPGLTGTDLR
jgi:hypothetical protein